VFAVVVVDTVLVVEALVEVTDSAVVTTVVDLASSVRQRDNFYERENL
jgi:hypothetical protein